MSQDEQLLPVTDATPVVTAHSDDAFAARFGAPEFRIRGTRCIAEGEHVLADGDKEPETIVPDLFATCSYCGSLSVADVLTAMQTAGTHYSGSDWKYGWPHKFYIEIPCPPYRRSSSSSHRRGDGGTRRITSEWREDTKRSHKFYAVHLREATEGELAQWNTIAAPLLGISYTRDEGGQLHYSAPHRGYQTWGDVP